jgi:palmitoyltransferase
MVWSVRTRKTLSNTVGYFCIFVFFSLTTYIVYVYYATLAPSVYEKKEYKKFIFHFIFGNWVTINIYFNYIMAWLKSPGLAKDYQNQATQYPVCKKCSMNKPPRTHHCGWCDLCVLKFDHHCPCKKIFNIFIELKLFLLGLNSCVGFYNHRYFFQFCCYMAIGCLYAGTFGYREYQIGLIKEQM